MARLPLDNETRRTDSRACAIDHYKFDSDHWQYREQTGIDVGCDCVMELSENNKWLGNKIECQIKGTRHLEKNYLLKKSGEVSFPLEVKTINYALGSANSFVLLVVDVKNEVIYYECLQDLFISDHVLYQKLDREGAKTINIRIPVSNRLEEDDSALQEIARARFLLNSQGELVRAGAI